MYYISKRLVISASHHLELSYPSKCCHLHGHNWIITVFCKAQSLNKNGMIIDFKQIKELIHKRLDHQNLNEVLDFNPTAENIAKWIVDTVPECYKAKVQESEGNIAVYTIMDENDALL